MDLKKIIPIVIISVFISGIFIFNGWLSEAVVFGYNIYYGWINGNDLQIPRNINVTTINRNKFAYMLLTDITIPDNIKNIENEAFRGNRLTNINIGSNVSLGNNAFGFGFENIYNNNGKHAGIFTRVDSNSYEWGIWHGDIKYSNYNGDIHITGYNGTGGEVEIPAEINGNMVTVIGYQAFMEKNLTGVFIPISVTKIEDKAFFKNRLTSVIIPNNVIDIGNETFDDNKLTSLNIGKSVTWIGKNAFAGNWDSKGKSNNTGNQLTSIIIPNSVGIIGDGAFRNNELTSVNIPDSVSSIGSNSFRANKLTRIFFPNNVRNIGVSAFAENPITRISIGENVSLGSDDKNGILGENSGFNTAYSNNKNRSGIYTRSSTKTTTWTRVPR